MARGLQWGLWRLLPLPLPLVTGSTPCLNLATVILQLVESEKHVFSGLGSEESILPSLIQFILFRFAVLTPSR